MQDRVRNRFPRRGVVEAEPGMGVPRRRRDIMPGLGYPDDDDVALAPGTKTRSPSHLLDRPDGEHPVTGQRRTSTRGRRGRTGRCSHGRLWTVLGTGETRGTPALHGGTGAPGLVRVPGLAGDPTPTTVRTHGARRRRARPHPMGLDGERACVHWAVPNLVVSLPLTHATAARPFEDANNISLVVSHAIALRSGLAYRARVRYI